MKYLVVWENKEVFSNGDVDITNDEVMCNSDDEVAQIVGEVLFDKFPVNPNFKVYTLINSTDKFSEIIANLNNTDKLKKQREDHENWLKSLKKSA